MMVKTVAARPRVVVPRGRTNTVVVRAGLFGKKKAAEPAKPAKKSGGLFGSIGSKPKAPAKKAPAPAKKSGGLFDFGSKPAPAKGTKKVAAPKKKAPAKKAAPAKKSTMRIGTKRAAAPAKSSGSSGTSLPFVGDISFEQFGNVGDDRYKGYRSEVDKSSKAKGAQKIIGYKGSGQKGSAPMVDAQGRKARFNGVVYRYADKYGGNIDEFSPIFTPETRSQTGDTYEPGLLGIAVWFAGFASLLAVGAFSIYSTSALAG